jgi:hypothetical protein
MKSKPIQAFTTSSIANSLRLINIDADASWGRLQDNRLREAYCDSSGSRHIPANEPAGMF